MAAMRSEFNAARFFFLGSPEEYFSKNWHKKVTKSPSECLKIYTKYSHFSSKFLHNFLKTWKNIFNLLRNKVTKCFSLIFTDLIQNFFLHFLMFLQNFVKIFSTLPRYHFKITNIFISPLQMIYEKSAKRVRNTKICKKCNVCSGLFMLLWLLHETDFSCFAFETVSHRKR